MNVICRLGSGLTLGRYTEHQHVASGLAPDIQHGVQPPAPGPFMMLGEEHSPDLRRSQQRRPYFLKDLLNRVYFGHVFFSSYPTTYALVNALTL